MGGRAGIEEEQQELQVEAPGAPALAVTAEGQLAQISWGLRRRECFLWREGVGGGFWSLKDSKAKPQMPFGEIWGGCPGRFFYSGRGWGRGEHRDTGVCIPERGDPRIQQGQGNTLARVIPWNSPQPGEESGKTGAPGLQEPRHG